jgi:hypothetical protein
MPKSYEEQRNDILGDASLSLDERHAKMLEVSERQAGSRGKTPAQLLAECKTSAEVAEVCRSCWAAQGDAVIEVDGTARWKREPQTEIIVSTVQGVFRMPASQLDRAREIDPTLKIVGNL